MRKSVLKVVLASSAAIFFLGGCPPSFPDRCSGAECIGCDLSREPKDSPLCIDDRVGVFVSPDGNDDGEGTKQSPVKSIGKAIEKADGLKLRVYICEGTYEEAIVLRSSTSLIGGFTCDWQPGAPPAKVRPKERGPALRIERVPNPIALADLEFTAQGALDSGESSIGGIVLETNGVTLRRVTVTAGIGASGANAPSPSGDLPTAPPGNSANGAKPGAAMVNDCSDGTSSTGGAGGDDGQPGDAGAPVLPPDPTPDRTGAGGTSACEGDGGAHPGSFGAGGRGGAGASKTGSVASASWASENGSAGGNGQTAQGGGGGRGGTGGTVPGGGGGGGPGGCGGHGGAAGRGGGSSIALLVLKSNVTLEACTLAAANAGNGGPGGTGQRGQPVSIAGRGGPGACAGEFGGHGGSGGGGGGGSGGASIALAYQGQAPIIDRAEVQRAETRPGWTTATAGASGSGGPGGEPAEPNNRQGNPGEVGSPGIPGITAAVLPL